MIEDKTLKMLHMLIAVTKIPDKRVKSNISLKRNKNNGFKHQATLSFRLLEKYLVNIDLFRVIMQSFYCEQE